MDAINCIAEFACNPHFTDINMAAIKHLKYCATSEEYPFVPLSFSIDCVRRP